MQTLQALAIEQVEQDAKQYDFIANNKEHWVESQTKHLQEVKQAILKGRLYIGVESVSASGMSRVIKIKYIKGNKLQGVDDLVYKIAGCDKNNRITGCGMDMLFAAQYNLFVTLCPRMRYQDKMPRYNEL